MCDRPPLLPLLGVVVELRHCGLGPLRPPVRVAPRTPGRVVGHHDLVADEPGAYALEVLLVGGRPGELGLPAGELPQRRRQLGVGHLAGLLRPHVGGVELDRLQEGLDVADGERGRPVLDEVGLLRVGAHALGAEDHAEPLHARLAQVALLPPQRQSRLLEPLQHGSQPLVVLLSRAVDEHVVLDLEHPVQPGHHLLDPPVGFAGGGAATHAESLETEKAPRRPEAKELARLLLEHELMKAMDHVQARVLVATCEVVPELLRGGDGLVGLVDERVERPQVQVRPNLGPPALFMGSLPFLICNHKI